LERSERASAGALILVERSIHGKFAAPTSVVAAASAGRSALALFLSFLFGASGLRPGYRRKFARSRSRRRSTLGRLVLNLFHGSWSFGGSNFLGRNFRNFFRRTTIFLGTALF